MSFELGIQPLMVFLLASIRVFVSLAVAPLFGHTVIPMRVRGGLALLIALLVPSSAPLALGSAPMAIAVGHEVIIGLAIGFAMTLVFAGISLMGELASVQGGLGAASVLDPANGASSLVLSTLVQSFALMIFVAVDGHHFVLRAMMSSFELFPIGGAGFSVAGFDALAFSGSLIFEIAVRFAAPITAVMMVTNGAVGALGRAIPQLNLMSLHLPAQIALLLTIMAFGASTWSGELSVALMEESNNALAAFYGGR